jgi:RNA polymerase sigma factor (sigma-70 family)
LLEDKAILDAIKNGQDDEVLKALYEKLYPHIEAFILKNSGTHDEAADVFQDAVLAFYKQVKKNRFDEHYTVSGFIFSISRNMWYNRVKKRNRNIELNEETHDSPEDKNVMDDLISKEREANINYLLNLLEERCRTILIYAIFHKFSMTTIKQKMGFRSEDVAKTKHYKCKQKLIKVLKENPRLKNLIVSNE